MKGTDAMTTARMPERRTTRAAVAAPSLLLFLLVTSGATAATAFSPAQIAALYDRVTPALCLVTYSAEVTNPNTGEVAIRQTRALGLLVSEGGLVITHGHMQREGAEPVSVRVTLGQGDQEREYVAEALHKPDQVNLSFLQIQDSAGEKFPYVRFRSDAQLRLGDPLLVLGMLGESFDYGRAILLRRVGAILAEPRVTYALDEALPFGFVTGPVVSIDGDVVGVVGFDLSPQEGGDLYIRSGHPLVYQSGLFEGLIANPPVAGDGDGTDAWLGVFTQPLTDDFAEYWGLKPDGGIVISTIVPDSPAGRAGMQRGDVITNFNGVPIRSKLDREVVGFTKLVREAGVGAEVVIQYLRGGQPIETKVVLTERPKSARDAGEYEDEVFGLTVREITTDLRYRLNISDDVQGVIVSRVKSGSWANIAQMFPGVIILNFGGNPVTSVEEFQAATEKVAEEKPAEVAVFCRVGPRTGFFRLNPRW